MKTSLVVIGIYLSTLLSGCQATSEVLGRDAPDKYIEVISTDPATDVAASLAASGKSYVCKEFYYGRGSSKNRKACFIKAPEESFYKRLGVKLQDVPGALIEDSGKTALVVGQTVLEVVLLNPFLLQ